MLEIILWGTVFVGSLGVLVKASDYFTDSAEEIGLFFKLPSFVIGVVIVTLGTSLPELISSIFAVSEGYSEIVVGTVVGSSVTNVFLILGIVAIFSAKKEFEHGVTNADLLALLGSTLLIAVGMSDGKFTFFEGALCLVGFAIFIYQIISSKRHIGRKRAGVLERIKNKLHLNKEEKFPVRSLVILLISSIFMLVAAKYLIDSVVYFSDLIQVGKAVIAASVVALGTSLPELVVSWTAIRKGNIDVAVGNILGANIFNSFVVMGVSAMIGDLIISKDILFFGLPMMVAAVFMYIFVIRDKKLTKIEGSFLLIFYVFYIGKLFGWF